MHRNVQIAKLTEHLKIRLAEDRHVFKSVFHRVAHTPRTLLRLQDYIYIINKYPCKKVSINQDTVHMRFSTPKRSFCTIRIRMTKTRYLEYGDFSTVTYEKDYHTYRYTHSSSTLIRILNVDWTEIFRHAKKHKAHYMEQYLHSIECLY